MAKIMRNILILWPAAMGWQRGALSHNGYLPLSCLVMAVVPSSDAQEAYLPGFSERAAVRW